MNQAQYLDALKRAMTGLPPETIAKTLAYYEQRFIDGLAAGRSAEEIANDLGDPKKIAITLRTSVHLSAFEQKRNPANLLRLVVSLVGLTIFNLFMVVPAMVYSCLLAAMYAVALAFYVSGVAITASGLAGANELVLDGPFHTLAMHDENYDDNLQTKISISNSGIELFQEPGPDAKPDAAAEDDESDSKPNRSSKMIKSAEAMAGHGVHVSTSMDAGSRTTQALLGMGMVMAGILLFLLSLVVTRYTFIGIKRYIEMNFSLLKGS